MKKVLLLIKESSEYTGFNLINKQVANSESLNSNYKIKKISISLSGKSNSGKSKIFVLISNLKKIFFTLISYKPDLIYFTISPVKAFLRDFLYVLLLKIFRQKVIYHLHGKGIKQKAAVSTIYKFLYRFTFRNSEVICLSENLTSDISDVYNGKPIILNNGIPVVNNPFSNIETEQDKVKIIFLSNFMLSKGIMELLQALKTVKDNGYKFCALLIGDYIEFSYKQLMELVTQYNLIDNVNIVGPKYGRDKIDYLRNADVFIYPTLNDAFPLVLLEAMQCALPIIAYDEGGIKNIVEDGFNGYVVDKLNKNDLAVKISGLISDFNLRNTMGENSLRLFNQKFTLEIFEKNLLNTFGRVMIDV